MTVAPTTTAHSKADLEAMAASVGFWWHSIDLGQGVVTNGYKTPAILKQEMAALQIPDLSGKTVLDIGAYDGFFSFEAEKRGAKRVVALDHYAWSIDLPKSIAYWRECKEKGVTPRSSEEMGHWQPETLPGKRGYDTAHKALNSRVETVIGDFMTMDLTKLGTFDVVFFMGVLYHMENPLASMQRLAALTKGLAIIETHAVAVPGFEHLEICEFYSAGQLNGDTSNWWGPNLKALEGMCRASGFNHVTTVSGNPHAAHPPRKKRFFRELRRLIRDTDKPTAPSATEKFRAMVHARK